MLRFTHDLSAVLSESSKVTFESDKAAPGDGNVQNISTKTDVCMHDYCLTLSRQTRSAELSEPSEIPRGQSDLPELCRAA